MQRPLTSFDPSRGVRHPVWGCALALLLLNDHVLKGAGLLPGALTGKLSDFAGLVVAPVLAVALLRARSARARALIFALTGAVFAAIKTIPAASALYEQALGLAGLHARNVCDPSDLVALAVLPLAWRLTTPSPDRERGPGGEVRTARGSSWRERFTLALGGVACMATSQPNPRQPAAWNTDAFVVNRTDAPIDLRIRWVAAALDCERVARDPAGVLRREMFAAQPVTFRIDPAETFPLDRIAAAMAGANGTTGAQTMGRTCEAVLLQADNLTSVAVFWRGRSFQRVPVNLAAGQTVPGMGVALEPNNVDVRATTASRDLTLFALSAEPRACATPTARYQVGETLFTGNSLTATARITVREVQRLPDGCTRVEGVDWQGETHRLFVCVPPEAVRFVAGDELAIEQGRFYNGWLYTLSTERRRLRVFSAVAWTQRAVFDGVSINFAAAPNCAAHSSCGSFVERYDLVVDGAPLPLRAGTTVRAGQATVYLGRAERVVVAPDACSSEYRETGPVADLAIVTGD